MRLLRFHEKVPVEVYSSSIIIPVSIGENTYNFRIDTGAPTGISNKIFSSIGANVIDSLQMRDIYGNIAWVKRTIIPEIHIGNSRFKHISAGIVRPIQDLKSCNIEIDGYLGSDFFSDKILSIDIKHSEVIITNYLEKLTIDKSKALAIDFVLRQKTPLLPVHITGHEYENVIFD